MTRLIIAVALLLVLAASSGSSQAPEAVEGDEEQGPTAADDDPYIYEWEIVAPAIDSRDPTWEPAYKWHEDPASLRCDGRDACEGYKATEVAKAESGTNTGAPR